MNTKSIPGATASTTDVVVQVGADAPVVLAALWSSIQRAPRGLEQRMAEQQHEAATRREHPRHLGNAGSNASTCSSARHSTTASNAPLAAGWPPHGRARRRVRRHDAGLADLGRRRIEPDDLGPRSAIRRATCPSPHPMSSTRRAPRTWLATSGRIWSSYSTSAPPVNSRCHQPACCSQSASLSTVPTPLSAPGDHSWPPTVRDPPSPRSGWTVPPVRQRGNAAANCLLTQVL